jgi:hypothetical protein
VFLARLLSFGLGLVFAWAAAAKIVRPAAWARALTGYRPPESLHAPVAIAVPVLEGGLAALFFAGQTRVASAATLALASLFSLAVLRARALRGSRLPCGCFGSTKERDYRVLIARNALLVAAAGALLIYGRDVRGYPQAPSGDGWIAASLVAVGAALLVWLFVAVMSGFRRGTT